MKCISIVTIGCILAFSCRLCPEPVSPSGSAEKRNLVASLRGLDGITHTHIKSLLRSNGINCHIEGSIAYGVFVQSKDVNRATNILKADVEERQYFIWIYDGEETLKYSPSDTHWKTVTIKKKYQDVLEEYAESTDIGSVLRSSEVKAEIPTFPYVLELKSLERKYLATNNELQTGHELRVTLAVSVDEEIGTKVMFFQVWDDGKRIQTMGSREWRREKP